VAITVVQSPAASSASAATLSNTISVPGVGNQLIVMVATDALNSAISLSALTSQVWVKLIGVDGGATQADLAVFASTNPGTGTTVTLNNGSSVSCGMQVIEVAGGAGASTDDGHSTSTVNAGAGTAYTCANVTPTIPGDLLVTWMSHDSSAATLTGPTSGPVGGWTILAATATVNTYRGAYNILTGTPVCAANWVSSVNDARGFAIQCCVKALAAGGGLPFQYDPIPFIVR
jgi:hypothetical protein